MRWQTLAVVLALPALALAADSATADSLKYRIEGLDKAQRDNVRAWLGDPPQTAEERSAFLVTAPERVRKSLQALGYYDSKAHFTLVEEVEPWQLTIEVAAGEPVIVDVFDVHVTGEAARDPDFEQLLRKPPLDRGEIMHHGHYEDLKNSLLSLGLRRGYFDGRIRESRVAVESDALRASVLLHYESGQRYRFGALQYDDSTLGEAQLRSLQPFTRGEPFLLAKLQEFQSQLQRTGYFDGVLVQPRVAESVDGEVPLILTLYPAERHSFEVGIGYSTDTEERITGVWRTPRINRHGHSQETRFEYSAINPSGRIIYKIPLSHPLDDVLQLGARLERTEYGDIDSDQAGVGVRRELRNGRWIHGYSLRYLNERWDTFGVTRDRDFLLPGVSLAHKYREGLLVDPSRGLSQFYQIEGAGQDAGSDLDLVRLYGKLIHVTTLPDSRHRFVGRLEAGAVFVSGGERDDLPPSLSFFTGGSQSVRGYEYQGIGREVAITRADGSADTVTTGGKRLLVGSLEYQYRLFDNWRAAVFVDAGDAFDKDQFNAKVGVGAGLHYLTPVGALKVEVANSVSEDTPSWRVHLNIGAEF